MEAKLKHRRRARASRQRPNLLLLLRSISASSALPKPRRVALDLLQVRRRSLLLVVWRVLLLLVVLGRGVVGLLLELVWLLLPVLLLLLLLSKTAVSISRAVGVMHLHVVGHLVMRGRGHWRGVAPARDCVFLVVVERKRGRGGGIN